MPYCEATKSNEIMDAVVSFNLKETEDVKENELENKIFIWK